MDNVVSMTVAILAAGEGSRLRGHNPAQPKPSIEVCGLQIAEWSLRAFAGCGMRDFRIGLGFRAPQVRDTYSRIADRLDCCVDFVDVPNWQLGNGVTALELTRSFGSKPFILSMADHVFSPRLINKLVASKPSNDQIALAVDPFPESFVDLDDLTKVRLDEGKVVAIGKEITPWQAGDTGLFVCGGALGIGLEQAQSKEQFSLSAGVQQCAADGLVRAVEMTEPRLWIDIDTPLDIQAAIADRASLLEDIRSIATSLEL